jgi:glycosyltransferase involved in cell wall biosynthesis
MILDVSLIVPIKNEASNLELFVAKIFELNCLPNEVIFIDAGSTDGSSIIINKFYTPFKNHGINFQFLYLHNAFPGKARNLGIQKSNNSWVCFLDVGILPDKNWLNNLWQDSIQHKSKVVFGKCSFNSDLFLGKIICALSYGINKCHTVVPASLFHKKIFEDFGYFRENLRAAEDIVWRNNLYQNKIYCVESNTASVRYIIFPNSFIKIINKWFIYSMFESLASVTSIFKIVIFSYLIVTYLLFVFSIHYGLILLISYISIRGFYDPIRRSNFKKWWTNWTQFFLAPFVALIIDTSAIFGFIYGKFTKIVYKLKNIFV